MTRKTLLALPLLLAACAHVPLEEGQRRHLVDLHAGETAGVWIVETVSTTWPERMAQASRWMDETLTEARVCPEGWTVERDETRPTARIHGRDQLRMTRVVRCL